MRSKLRTDSLYSFTYICGVEHLSLLSLVLDVINAQLSETVSRLDHKTVDSLEFRWKENG